MNTLLWELLDKSRGQRSRYSALDMLKDAKSKNIAVSFDDLRNLVLRDDRGAGAFLQPESVINFVISYFKDGGLESVLDCWAGAGALLLPLVEKYKPAVAVGLNQNFEINEIAQLMESDQNVKWHLGDPLNLLNEITTRFDAVVGYPPFGVRSSAHTFWADDRAVELIDEYANLLLLKASLLLNNSGSALFVLPPSFLFRRNERRVIDNLSQFGLFIDAVFHLPSGTFGQQTQLPGLLVVVRHQTQSKLFVGEITSDRNQTNVLLNNFKARKEGKSPQLGTLVDLDSFHSFPALVAEYEINGFARTLGLPRIRLSDICTSINLPIRGPGAEFVDLPNSVYLPLPTIGNSLAVASLGGLTIKAQNYIQFVVDPEKAIATYLAQFFNTSIGRKIRESVLVGTLPKITKSNLTKMIVFLPTLADQIEIITTQTTITDISSKLDTLGHELWNHPQKYKSIQKFIKSMQPSNDFVDWIETLPFPISSILWVYHANADIEDKIEHLFLFFEALAEFVAVIMLSSYASDKSFYVQRSGAWIEEDPKYRDWVLTSSFGGWRILGERLAKVTRSLQNKDERDFCAKLFGNPTSEFLSMLTDKDLFATLRKVNDYRDQWKGHSGALSYRDHQQHLALLESALSEIRKILQDRWDGVLLLSAGSNEYSDGIFEYQAKALIGTRTFFKQVTVKTLTPMDKNKIYMLHAQQQRPIELLPFIRLMESPKTQENAIYFYNRMVGDEVRWLSYHFDKESEIIRPDSAVDSAIKLLQPPTKDEV